MTSDSSGLPDTPEGLNAWMDGLTFHPEQTVPDGQLPPLLEEGADALVPRSVKIPQRLDDVLRRLAAEQRVSKSDLLRRYIEAGVAADLATEGEQVLIPLADALRALAGLQQLPRTA